jgi:hypothetical protein
LLPGHSNLLGSFSAACPYHFVDVGFKLIFRAVLGAHLHIILRGVSNFVKVVSELLVELVAYVGVSQGLAGLPCLINHFLVFCCL